MFDINKLLDTEITLKCRVCKKTLTTNLSNLQYKINCECGYQLSSGNGESYQRMKLSIENSSTAFIKRFVEH